MAHRDAGSAARRAVFLPPSPFDADHWQALAAAMGLSPREAEIAEFKIRGAELKEIAAQLGIKVASVRGFQARIFAKMGIRRHEFVAHILRLSQQIHGKRL